MNNVTQLKVEKNVVFKYQGHDILLNGNMRFAVPSLGDNYTLREWASFDDAKAAIDRVTKAEKRLKARRVHMPVINERGERLIVRGMNRTKGDLAVTTAEGRKTTYHGNLYPDVSWIPEQLERVRAARAVLADLERPLSKLSVRLYSGYGQITAERANDAIDRLERELNKAKESASLVKKQYDESKKAK